MQFGFIRFDSIRHNTYVTLGNRSMAIGFHIRPLNTSTSLVSIAANGLGESFARDSFFYDPSQDIMDSMKKYSIFNNFADTVHI